MLDWHHGTPAKNWADSGWVLDGVLYAVEYSDDPNGPDKILGRWLLRKDVLAHPDKYHPELREKMMRDDQAEHEKFEELCGGPSHAFRLMKIHERARQTVSGDRFDTSRIGRERSPSEVFRRLATQEGYTVEQIEAFLRLP